MPPSTSSQRSPFLDNAKGILILLVVWYHALVVYYSTDLPLGVSGLETILLLFVMPSFSLLSGYTSSPNMTIKRQNNLLTSGTAFILFQLLNWGMGILNTLGFDAYVIVPHHNQTNATSIPYPIPIFFPTVMGQLPDTKALPVTWFLLALLFWRALTPVIVRLRYPVCTSILLSLLALTVDLGFGSQNIVSFFPFYVVGVCAKHRTYGQVLWHKWVLMDDTPTSHHKTTMRTMLITSCLFLLPLLASIVVSAWNPLWWDNKSRYGVGFIVSHGYSCLYGLVSAAEPSCTSWYAWLSRSIFYLFSFPIIVGGLRLVPRKRIVGLTKAGINSFAIYLFHPLVLFNIISLVLICRGLDLVTNGQGSVKHNGAPPYVGGISFVLITCVGVGVWSVLSMSCWLRCCWVCLRPPVVVMMMEVKGVKGVKVVEEKEEEEEEEEEQHQLSINRPLLR